MAMTAGEWIRTITPIVVLTATGLVGFVRMDAQVQALEKRLDSECVRSSAFDAAQDERGRRVEVAVGKMETQVANLSDRIGELVLELRE